MSAIKLDVTVSVSFNKEGMTCGRLDEIVNQLESMVKEAELKGLFAGSVTEATVTHKTNAVEPDYTRVLFNIDQHLLSFLSETETEPHDWIEVSSIDYNYQHRSLPYKALIMRYPPNIGVEGSVSWLEVQITNTETKSVVDWNCGLNDPIISSLRDGFYVRASKAAQSYRCF